MPTNRTRRMRVRKQDDLSPLLKQFMFSGVADDGMDFDDFFVTSDEDALGALWNEHRDVLMMEWLENNAGSRPFCWWLFDATEQRLRLGGKGTAINDCCLGYMQPYPLGLPTAFVSEWQVAYYNGQTVDIHGKRIMSKYKEGSFEAEPYDESDKPQYESEASYLQRLGLLTEGEKRVLAKKRSVFEPVTVER